MSNQFQTLLTKLGIQFKYPELLYEAFTHRSYLNEAGKNRRSNERLEFLGDAILSFLVSRHLFHAYPEHPEGLLTNLRSTIVKTETLSDISQSLGFGKYLYLSRGEEKGGGRLNPSLLADTFEAFLAAVFLDQGIRNAQVFLKKVLYPRIPDIIKNQLHADFKSKLQEVVQEFSNFPPTYKLLKTEGPDHAKHFWVRVIVDEVEKEIGEGRSKQEAEQAAAAKTLEKMGKI